MEAPCKDCPNRTKPKHCELNCEKWKKYKEEHEIQKEKIFNYKSIKYELSSNKKRRHEFFN